MSTFHMQRYNYILFLQFAILHKCVNIVYHYLEKESSFSIKKKSNIIYGYREKVMDPQITQSIGFAQCLKHQDWKVLTLTYPHIILNKVFCQYTLPFLTLSVSNFSVTLKCIKKVTESNILFFLGQVSKHITATQEHFIIC